MSSINSYDFDGVVYMGPGRRGVYPGPKDFIITGRSLDEAPHTFSIMKSMGLRNQVMFNKLKFNEKTRESSGWHKVNCINELKTNGIEINIHFEDDPIQAQIIKDNTNVSVVLLQHDLVEKENVWHEV
jgi:hypothetical protein